MNQIFKNIVFSNLSKTIATGALLSQVLIFSSGEGKTVEQVTKNSLSDSIAQVKSEAILEGVISGVIERYIEEELGSEEVSYQKNWGNKIRTQTGVRVIKVRKCKKDFWGNKHCYNEPQTRRTYSEVNHGLWLKSVARLEDDLDIDLRNFSFDGSNLSFEVISKGLIRAKPHIKVYNHGAKLVEVAPNSRARIKSTVNTNINFCRDGSVSRWSVRASNTDIKLEDFYLDRIGPLGGYSAKVIGDAAHGIFRFWFTKNYNKIRNNTRKKIVEATAHDREVKAAYIKYLGSKIIRPCSYQIEIHNQTNQTVNYTLNGEKLIVPINGYYNYFSLPTEKNGKQVPPPFIKFDYNFASGYQEKAYQLKKSLNARHGAKYVFKKNGNGVDLFYRSEIEPNNDLCWHKGQQIEKSKLPRAVVKSSEASPERIVATCQPNSKQK